jgi:tRNA G10  N-methylase Trm11
LLAAELQGMAGVTVADTGNDGRADVVLVTAGRMRQRGGREIERSGALRPTVAAAMVQLAGQPDGALLDPCCGSGTILMAAAEAGWRAQGSDIDPEAVRIARTNAPGVAVRVGDVRRLTLDDCAVHACVGNLPFGKQYAVPQDMSHWLRAGLAEMARVTRPGGRIVLLAPAIAPDVVPGTLALARRVRIRLLGTQTTIWAYDRR